jgi:multiple antibiotic resistance protein
MDYLSISVTLFLIMDPFGNIPNFLSILDKVRPERRRRILIRELFFALGIIVLFALAGEHVMSFLGLQQDAVSMAGGIILFLIALRMVFPQHERSFRDDSDEEPLLVPLAIPLISGPSMLAALLLFSSTGTVTRTELLMGAGIAWAGVFVVLVSSTFLVRFLTKRGLTAVERLMGMVLVALSVQLFADGLSHYLATH